MTKYLWCEDKGSGYQFWKFIFRMLHPDFVVETKENNTRLRQAASRIEEDGNLYYILMDTVADNPDVLREVKALQRCIAGKGNVRVIRIHSFEFSLLSFDLLEQWVFTGYDELKEKRRILLDARKLFVELVINEGSSEELIKLKELLAYPALVNTEKISARLLYGITRNTGFETDKSRVGPCFVTACCEWKERKADDMCGLDRSRLSAEEKAQLLVEQSALLTALGEVGIA